MDRIYYDHAATTYVKPYVLEKMLPYFTEKFGNPSSMYALGNEAKSALENAREMVASCLGAKKNEIYFTASGSESDNWAIRGIAHAYSNKGRHIITSNIEHHAVLNTLNDLKKEGFEITFVPVEQTGIINPETVRAAIRQDTILITVIFANNEIGTIQPIAEIGDIAKEHGVMFHTDAVQAAGHIPIDVNLLAIDALSIAAHKFYGPKGVGAIFLRNGTKIKKFITGGAQESDRRAGTENVAGIVGLANALELSLSELESSTNKIFKIRNKIIDQVLSEIPYTILNGDKEICLPGIMNFSFEFIEGESLLLMLDMKGIAVSSGSACTSGSLDPSHVLLAIGLSHELCSGSIRVSLGDDNTEEQVDYFIQSLKEIVDKLRQMSPLYEQIQLKGD